MPGLFRLADTLRHELIARAAERPEEEICGLLAGQGGVPRRLLPVTNRLHRADAFDMDPAELIAAMRDLRESGQALVAIYHSHPHGPAYPSATDVAENQYPEAVHVIIGKEGGGWGVRAFRLGEGVAELAIRAE